MARFMYGRNGADQLCWALFIAELVLSLLPALVPGQAFAAFIHYTTLFLCVYLLFRMFSRNVYKRREENGKYIRARYKVSAALRVRHERWVQRKDYKFFTCPNCKTALRVPRGHGKVNIVCRKCGNTFTGKT